MLNMASSQPPLENSEYSTVIIQELIKEPTITVPNCYVRSDQELLKVLNGNDHFPEIPTIDLESLVSEDTEQEKLHATCKEWGIFQLVNHGVSSSLLDKLKHEVQEFYNLPVEEKMKYKVLSDDFEGYGGSVARSDGKFDWNDRLYMTVNPVHKRKSHLFPELPSSLRNTLESYLQEVQKISMKILGTMEKTLKMEIKEMEEMFEDGMQSMRISYYPPCSKPELVLGFTPHSDATGITILYQANGVNGLQIKKDGVWIPLNILPQALIVNVGDILQIMSNGLYRSVEHRATINSEKERISLAFFVNPRFDTEIGPATSMITPENPPLFKTIGMEDYVKGFFSMKLGGKSYLEHMKIENGGGNIIDTN